MKKSFWQRLKEVGPGAIVAAAFIGPGTVTSCFTSGASYGTTLLWAILFSTLSVIIMQSMASRLGIVTQKGLGEALRTKFTGTGTRIFLAILVIAAVFVGNVAYETGNVSGSILGIQAISTALDNQTWKIILACIIFTKFAGSPPAVDSDAAPAAMVWKYVGELVFNMLVLVGAVKMSDRISRELLGLG